MVLAIYRERERERGNWRECDFGITVDLNSTQIVAHTTNLAFLIDLIEFYRVFDLDLKKRGRNSVKRESKK